MAKIKLNRGNALDFNVKTDLIFTDPPFDMPAPMLCKILDKVACDHLVLITTMKQLIELMRISKWQFNFDFVLDAVTPKKSKSINQPNYAHSTGVYLTRNGAKSLFNRKLRQRSDTFDNNGYWPTVIRAPRERLSDHGMAKNEKAITDILGSFSVKSVYDPFAGSGTVGFAAVELGLNCELTELDRDFFERLESSFAFFKPHND
jgi:16S rRNA G966 N2-methylase RsmD